jgi:hypothetical protein
VIADVANVDPPLNMIDAAGSAPAGEPAAKTAVVAAAARNAKTTRERGRTGTTEGKGGAMTGRSGPGGTGSVMRA